MTLNIAVTNINVPVEIDAVDVAISVTYSIDRGNDGISQYQSYLDTTLDNPVLTEQEWSDSFVLPANIVIDSNYVHTDNNLTGELVAEIGTITDKINRSETLTSTEIQLLISNLVDSSPDTLNTLNELANALGDDPNFATTISTALGNKVDKVTGKGLSTNDLTQTLIDTWNGKQSTITPTADTTPVDTDYIITQRADGWLKTLVSDFKTNLGLTFAKLSGATFSGTVIGTIFKGTFQDLNGNTPFVAQNGGTIYHATPWINTGTVSTSGITVTGAGTSFTAAMVGAKIIINNEERIIATRSSNTIITVNSAFGQNYSGQSFAVYCFAFRVLGGSVPAAYIYSSNGTLILATEYGELSIINDVFGPFGGGQWKLDANTGLGLRPTGAVRWSSISNNAAGTPDLSLSRNSAGVLEINNGTAGTFRDLILRQLRLGALNTAPASATDTGVLGEIRIDANYIYFCFAANQWKRTALTTW